VVQNLQFYEEKILLSYISINLS